MVLTATLVGAVLAGCGQRGAPPEALTAVWRAFRRSSTGTAEGGFTDARLLELAERVEGLRGPAFGSAVKDMKYRAFVTASQKAHESAGGSEEPGGPGTPTAVINHVRIPADHNGLLFDAPLFSNLLRQIRKAPGEWGAYVFPEVTGTPGLS